MLNKKETRRGWLCLSSGGGLMFLVLDLFSVSGCAFLLWGSAAIVFLVPVSSAVALPVTFPALVAVVLPVLALFSVAVVFPALLYCSGLFLGRFPGLGFGLSDIQKHGRPQK